MNDSKRPTVKEILEDVPPHQFPAEDNLNTVRWINTSDSIADMNVIIARTQHTSIAHKAAIARRDQLHFEANETSGSKTLRWAKIAGCAAIVSVIIGIIQCIRLFWK
jgi:hypothetical protein